MNNYIIIIIRKRTCKKYVDKLATRMLINQINYDLLFSRKNK